MSLFLALLMLCLCLAGCGTGSTSSTSSPAETTPTPVPIQEMPPIPEVELSVDPMVPQKVSFTMADGASFVIETAPQYAPRTVQNFLYLVETGFYNGLTFHRILDGFVAQGGDPKGDGTGGSEKTIPGEFSQNGFEQNTLSHVRGTVSMARTNDVNSASSQFFICYGDVSYLDGGYAGFGTVIEGMEVIDAFLKLERDQNGKPTVPPVIKTAVIVK